MSLDTSAVLEDLKMYKAPGPDGIPNEFYYLLKENEHLGKLLGGVFNEMIGENKIPDSMRETYYRLLYKKGHFTEKEIKDGKHGDAPHLLTNWRPIGLLCCDYKIMYAALANVIKPHLNTVVSKMQNAFVPGRNIINNAFSIIEILKFHSSGYLGFWGFTTQTTSRNSFQQTAVFLCYLQILCLLFLPLL